MALAKAAELFQLHCPGGRELALSLLEGSGAGPAGAGLVAVPACWVQTSCTEGLCGHSGFLRS